MKSSVFFLVIIFFLSTYSVLAQKIWTGIGGNGLWTTASNWSGNSVPTSSDDVVLDNSNVSGSYTVTIPPSGFAVCGTLKIGYSGNSNTITLLFQSQFVRGGGGNPAGLTFGNGASGNIDFLIDEGGVFINASTAASGTNYIESAGLDDLARVKSGAKFIQVTDRSFKNPFPSTNITFEPGSTMEWNARGSIAVSPEVSGYTFGNLIFAADSAGGLRTYSSPGGGGSLVTVLNDWIIKSGVTMNPWGTDVNANNILFDGTMSFGTAGVNINISGNITTNAEFTTSTSPNSLMTLNGSALQTIGGNDPLTFGGAVILNNPDGLQLNNNVVMNGSLTLSNGIITSSTSSVLTIGANGSIIGANKVNFIKGPLQRILASALPSVLTFPIGKGSSYRPVSLTITQGSAASTAYKVEVFNTAPPKRTLPSSLDRVSFVRYFNVSKGAGSNVISASVTINYDTANIDDGVRNSSNLRVAKDDGSGNWIDIGGDVTSANFVGSITPSNSFTSFGDFVLANNVGGTNKLGGLPPAAPVLVSLSNGEKNTAVDPSLKWRSSADAQFYQLQLALDSTFTSSLFNDSLLTDTILQVGPLNYNTKYFWRVSASNISGKSLWSEIWNFTTIVAVPNASNLISPLDNSKDLDTTLNLVWKNIKEASSYIVQLSLDSSFSSFIINDSLVTDTAKQINGLSGNSKYFWRVASVNVGGISPFTSIWNFSTKILTGIKLVGNGVPVNYRLYQNYPNPFNPITIIRYDLPFESNVNLEIYNLIGQVVKVIRNETEPPGSHEINFNAGDLASGVYIYKIIAKSVDGRNELNAVKKFILLK